MPPVLVNEKTIAMYAAYLARRLRPASVRQYLNIVRVMHLEAGLSNPLKDSWFISSTLKGTDRVKGMAVNRNSPITPDILLHIKKVLKMSDRDDIVFWRHALLCFLAYFVRPTCLQNKSLMWTSTSPGTLLCSMPTVR